jgi:hypothetical protein
MHTENILIFINTKSIVELRWRKKILIKIRENKVNTVDVYTRTIIINCYTNCNRRTDERGNDISGRRITAVVMI